VDAEEFDAKKRKLEKKLGADLSVELQKSSNDRLKDLVVNLSKEIEKIEQEKEADAKLAKLKEMLKDLSGGYNDARKEKKIRLQYCLMTLQERGEA